MIEKTRKTNRKHCRNGKNKKCDKNTYPSHGMASLKVSS
jgi:hypothetical protein